MELKITAIMTENTIDGRLRISAPSLLTILLPFLSRIGGLLGEPV